jgi:hypothetical protein
MYANWRPVAAGASVVLWCGDRAGRHKAATIMNLLRRWLAGRAGKLLAASASLLAAVAAALAVWSHFQEGTSDDARYTMFICSETGKTFRHKNQLGEVHPIRSPYSGKNTAVPAEACYWTAAGVTKSAPTWVLLEESVGRPGPTFCPDCGRLVVGHNPSPRPGGNPPPTRGEYAGRKASRQGVAGSRDER